MTHNDLKAWREQMCYTHRAAAESLGISLRSYQELERGSNFTTGAARPIDRRTALACAALAAHIAPWGSSTSIPD